MGLILMIIGSVSVGVVGAVAIYHQVRYHADISESARLLEEAQAAFRERVHAIIEEMQTRSDG